MDTIRTVLEMALSWVAQADPVPLAYAAEDRVPVSTRSRPLLEFGYHSEGSESVLSVPGLERRSVPGTLAVLNAHYGNRGTPARSWAFWCVSLSTETCPDPVLCSEPVLETVALQHNARVRSCFEEVGRQYKRAGPTQPYRIKADMLRLLLTLHEAAGYADAEPIYSPPCEAAVDYLDNHLGDADLDLAALAHAACLSTAQLCRLFKSDTGTTPMKYVTSRRLARARELLQRTALNIGEIANAVGFRDPLHFSRVFRRETGMPPTIYRRRDEG